MSLYLNSLQTLHFGPHHKLRPRRHRQIIMPPKSLEDFPWEIQAPILNFLSCRDLASLSLVSKSARHLAEPFIYAEISLTWACDHLPPLSPLLRTLLERPDLARHVRRLRLDGTEFTKGPSLGIAVEPPALPISVLPLTKASVRIRSTRVPYAQRWVDELNAGAVDALVALLVSMLPNLILLCLGSNFTIKNTWLGHMLRYALALDAHPTEIDLPRFHSLTQVAFSRRTDEWRHKSVNNTADVLPFLYLPNIQSLSVSIDNPKESAWSVTQLHSSLTCLELYRLRETRLGPLLSKLKSLRKLHWHWHYRENFDSYASSPIVELDMMAAALSYVAETLTDLTIEAETFPDVLGGDYEPPTVVTQGSLRGGLSKLQKLRTLCLPWLFLMGPSPDSAVEAAVRLGDSLPSSIEVLTTTSELLDHEQFDWQDGIFTQAIRAALRNQKAMASLIKLERIVLPVPYASHSITEELLAELQELSAQSGINLKSEDDQ